VASQNNALANFVAWFTAFILWWQGKKDPLIYNKIAVASIGPWTNESEKRSLLAEVEAEAEAVDLIV
jgi:hypothetical protein